MKEAYFVVKITVIDPDSKALVEMEVYKHENGGMFAVDSSFLDQFARRDDFDRPRILDPLTDVEDDAFDEIILFN